MNVTYNFELFANCLSIARCRDRERQRQKQRDRQTEVETERDKETDRETETERDRETDRETETERHTERQKQRQRQTDRQRETDRKRETKTETDRQKQRTQTGRQTDREEGIIFFVSIEESFQYNYGKRAGSNGQVPSNRFVSVQFFSPTSLHRPTRQLYITAIISTLPLPVSRWPLFFLHSYIWVLIDTDRIFYVSGESTKNNNKGTIINYHAKYLRS